MDLTPVWYCFKKVASGFWSPRATSGGVWMTRKNAFNFLKLFIGASFGRASKQKQGKLFSISKCSFHLYYRERKRKRRGSSRESYDLYMFGKCGDCNDQRWKSDQR
ncbi:hypothetical protein Ddye_030077 [Dipteronia dyeriana]|uniref:Uncharacterized protein n=1 Tax=Dipteronia dyeriana TaxID=168575 RepID=A0AAD9TFM3_9ROSI|nr:hypothetical protein Ddye_030077 [Dipteronia dyeriana]